MKIKEIVCKILGHKPMLNIGGNLCCERCEAPLQAKAIET